ncbi:MAG: helix-turn-helix transcriptional regulator [Nitrospirae bacterium]|nr:helix-turn-helix transcriptional regulator [Nitrospirota bacterium]
MKKSKTGVEDICQVICFNEKKVKALRKSMLPSSLLNDLADTFKAMADNTRIRIISALSKEELCVCDLANLLNLSISAVSHQLRILRNMKLVKFRREGKRVYYSLDDRHIENLFIEGLKHVRE